MNREEILQLLTREKSYLQKAFDVEKIGLFGSYAKNLADEKSDIDIYVEFRHKTFRNLAGLWVYLENLYNRKIDLLHKHKHAKGAIFDQIQREVVYR